MSDPDRLFQTTLARAKACDLSVLDLISAAEALTAAGMSDAVIELYRTWIEHGSNHPLLHAVRFNYGVTLSDRGRLDEARSELEAAIALVPEFAPARINLGRVLERQGDATGAVAQWSTLADILAGVTGAAVGHRIMALNQIARVFETNGQDEAAEALLRQSLDIDPRQREVAQHYLALRQRLCAWPVAAPTERIDRETLMRGMSPLSLAALTDDPMLHLAAAWNYNRLDVGDPAFGYVGPPAPKTGGRLRLGYLSSDLREHAVGYLAAELFELHDRDRVEVFAYFCGPPGADPLQERIKAAVEHWIDLTDLDDEAAARRMAEDGLHVLIDLNGYTRDARTKALARRPAPVIVNWLGYPGTMGSPYHHYIIADDWIIPPESEVFYSERVVRLPCYQPNDRKRPISSRQPSRADMGLPEGAVVFCCFNGLHKLGRFTMARWCDILARVPNSVLWLLQGGSEAAHQRLRAAAAARGIAPDRLIFAPKQANPDHLARYPLADLFLDSAPYGAHTTASDALWMGVPVLTLSGRSFASRVCGSLVRAAGLPELVCTSPEDYVERAVALGRDPGALAALAHRLAQRRDDCVLFDMAGLTRRLEDLVAAMWADAEAGRLPRPDLANLDVYLEVGTAGDAEAEEMLALSDYRAWWRQRLEHRHRLRPIAPDTRLWRD